MDWQHGEYTVSDDPLRLDRDMIHGYLTTSYWAEGIGRDVVDRSIENSIAFGVYHGASQVGFARVITDKSTFAYLADVFVVESHQGRGLGSKLMASIMAHPELQGLRRWLLFTRDAHGLYGKFGFTPPASPQNVMEIWRPGFYLKAGERA